MTDHARIQQILDRRAHETCPGVFAQVPDSSGTWSGGRVGRHRTSRPREREEQFRVKSIGKTFTTATPSVDATIARPANSYAELKSWCTIPGGDRLGDATGSPPPMATSPSGRAALDAKTTHGGVQVGRAG